MLAYPGSTHHDALTQREAWGGAGHSCDLGDGFHFHLSIWRAAIHRRILGDPGTTAKASRSLLKMRLCVRKSKNYIIDEPSVDFTCLSLQFGQGYG